MTHLSISRYLQIAALYLAAATALTAQPKITLTGSSVAPGHTATVTATLSGSAGTNTAAFQFFFNYNTALTITPTPGPVVSLSQKTLQCAVNTARTSYGCVVSGGVTTVSDGVIGTFQVDASTSAGATTFTLNYLLSTTPTAVGSTVLLAGNPLPVVIPVVVASPCDVNGDGVTSLLDVVNVIDQITGVILPNKTDIDNNGRTDVIDVQRVVNAIVAGGVCRVGP